jgi:glutathione peroxidase-family protein
MIKASKCGLTPLYNKDLEAIYKEYQDKAL